MESISAYTISIFQMVVVFITLSVALYFYATEKISIEITSAWVLSFLMVFFYVLPVLDAEGKPALTVSSILAGFSNPALITVFSLMIIGETLAETGALEAISSIIAKRSRKYPTIGMVFALIIVGIFSAFLNNIPMVVVFIPVIVGLTKRFAISPTRWLMPLSFITILGGMVTLVGSSTNLLVSGTLVKFGRESLDFFSFSPIGILLAGSGAIYVLLILPNILPKRKSFKYDMKEDDNERRFFSNVFVDGVSPLAGKEIYGQGIKDLDIDVLVIQRGRNTFEHPFNGRKILPGDEVLLSAKRDNLLKVANQDIDNLVSKETENIDVKDQVLAEVIVSHNSSYLRRTLRSAALHINRKLTPIGLERNSAFVQNGILDIKLRAGDVLLVVGDRDSVNAIMEDADFILVESSAEEIRHPHHVRRTLSIFFLTIATAATGILPIPIASFTGAVLMIAFGCISFTEAFKAIDRRVILLIATSLALGLALQKTGGAATIAENILYLFQGFGASVILSVFFLAVMIMTNILSNQATAVLFTPIAISLAENLHVDIHAFIFAVIFAANCSFVTPVAYQTNLLVMNPGQYTFMDFVKAGFPLALFLWMVYSVVAPIYFNF